MEDWESVNTLRPRQNGRHFADDTFKHIFMNENIIISTKNSLKFVPKGPINNNPALVQIMTWRRSGDKPLSEPMMVSLLTHICVTRPQWVNLSYPGRYNIKSKNLDLNEKNCEQILHILCDCTGMDANNIESTLVQVMAWCHQATHPYLSQCWPRSMFPYGITIGHNQLTLSRSRLNSDFTRACSAGFTW